MFIKLFTKIPFHKTITAFVGVFHQQIVAKLLVKNTNSGKKIFNKEYLFILQKTNPTNGKRKNSDPI